ncbi:MAG TPA: pirin family protein [Steroidobacteraceae bacterium]|nr:pirin family protein [Steroidobacteraceae bacterium]
MTVLATLRGFERDLGGGFRVRRMLPALARRSVGPFVFFDHFGPITVEPSSDVDVRPHPHIGLATVTYLFEGAMMHRDSLGSVQRIEPGAINWMSAGRGIVHSERRPADLATRRYSLHGLQLWTALPHAHEESLPNFAHTPAAALPEFEDGGATIRLLVGAAWGRKSPVVTLAATLYAVLRLRRGGAVAIPPIAEELAVYAADQAIEIDGSPVDAHTLAIVEAARPCALRAAVGDANVVLIGGDRPDGPRKLWWNFVSSRPERIEAAARDWQAGRMARIAGESEFIPLPANAPGRN